MRIGFFVQDEGIHWDIAKRLVSSARTVMPDVEIFQLTDEKCPVVEGASPIRLSGDMPMGVRRVMHYSRLEGDWVLLDTDVVFRKDVRPVFDEPFDVALATREGDPVAKTEYGRLMPYNFGVVFSRSQAFWRKILQGLVTMHPDNQRWGGEQYLTCKLAESGLYKFKVLPRAFNYTPEEPNEDVSGVSILHMKGKRKAWDMM